jgi:hypothetical protein
MLVVRLTINGAHESLPGETCCSENANAAAYDADGADAPPRVDMVRHALVPMTRGPRPSRANDDHSVIRRAASLLLGLHPDLHLSLNCSR